MDFVVHEAARALHGRGAMVDRFSSPLRTEHVALMAQLRAATLPGGDVDPHLWSSFREGLVRHLAIEERVVVPMLEALGVPELKATRRVLAHDHESILTLLVAAPNALWLTDLAERLAHHIEVEEGRDGLYDLMDRHLASCAAELEGAVRALGTVQLGPPSEGADTALAVSEALAAVGLRRK